MKKRDDIMTVTYDAGDGWLVDVVEMRDCFEVYLYFHTCGAKMYMGGQTKGTAQYWTADQVARTVEGVLADYIKEYREENMMA